MTRPKPAGFTLIELLVVVVIIAIVISVAVLSVNVLGTDSELDDEAKRIGALVGLVREQAEMQSRDYGLRFEEASYEFVVYDSREDEWNPPADDDLMRARELPPGLRFRLFLDGREAVLKPLKKDEDDKPPPPHVFILSNGDLSAFELILEREGSDRDATVIGKAEGSIEVQGVDYAKH